MKKILTSLILVTAIIAIVLHRSAFAETQTPIDLQSSATTISPTANEPDTFCPPIDDIVKDPTENIWTAKTKEGFWKTHSTSFATALTRFVGAQWVGAEVGTLTCVYHSQQDFTIQGQPTIQKTLPVLLVFDTLVFQPTATNWARASRGVYNCTAGQNGRLDCPFKIKVKPKTGDIYEEAAAIKETAPHPLQPPSY